MYNYVKTMTTMNEKLKQAEDEYNRYVPTKLYNRYLDWVSTLDENLKKRIKDWDKNKQHEQIAIAFNLDRCFDTPLHIILNMLIYLYNIEQQKANFFN